MRPKLLPCPFCGPEPLSYRSGGTDGEGMMIECLSDDCPVRPHCSYIPPASAVTAWNHRVGLDRKKVQEAVRHDCKQAFEQPLGLPLEVAERVVQEATDTILGSLGNG